MQPLKLYRAIKVDNKWQAKISNGGSQTHTERYTEVKFLVLPVHFLWRSGQPRKWDKIKEITIKTFSYLVIYYSY